jgi:hypothetical protein
MGHRGAILATKSERYPLLRVAIGLLALLACPLSARAQGMWCDCDNTSICDDLQGRAYAGDPTDLAAMCACDSQCGDGCICDKTVGSCDTFVGQAVRRCACDRDCFSGPLVTGRIASRGLVRYGADGKLASALDPAARPRWVELAIADDLTHGIRQGQALTDGPVFQTVGDRTDVMPMSVTEFNQWVDARLGFQQTTGVASYRTRTIDSGAFQVPDGEDAVWCMKDGVRRLARDVVPISPLIHTLVIREEDPNAVPCEQVILLKSPLALEYVSKRAPYDPQTGTGLSSFLIEMSSGRIVAASKHIIGQQTAFSSFNKDDPEEMRTVPSVCVADRIDSDGDFADGLTAPVPNATLAEVEAWSFVRCRQGTYKGQLRSWSPISGATVEMANYESIRSVRTDRAGFYAIQYKVLPGTVLDLNIFATLRYDDFNPRVAASRFYYVSNEISVSGGEPDPEPSLQFGGLYIGPGITPVLNPIQASPTSATTAAFSNFPIEAAMLNMKAELTNEGIAGAKWKTVIPVVDPTYQISTLVTADGGLNDSTLVPSTLTTQYEPNGRDEQGAPSSDRFRAIGLLKQISAADLRDTTVYIFRVADGRLIGSRWGLRHQELLGIRADINNDHDFDDPSETPPPQCEGPDQSGAVGPRACLQFSALVRGPASRYLSLARSELNPAANVFPVVNRAGELTKPGRFGIELDYADGLTDQVSAYVREGDQVKVVVLNRATGYIGSMLAEMRRQPGSVSSAVPFVGGMMTFVPLQGLRPRAAPRATPRPQAARASNRCRTSPASRCGLRT